MTVTTMPPIQHAHAPKPFEQYFDPRSTRTVAPGSVVHDYYGVPVWLMKDYLASLGATATGDDEFEVGQCHMRVWPAQHKHIGALEVGGATVEFTGTEGAIEAVLEDLEWKTLRCGG